jgi:hypothetical protein
VRTMVGPYVGAKIYAAISGPVGLSFETRWIVDLPGNSPVEEILGVTYIF